MSVIQLAERGWVPDSLIRIGIRKLCKERLKTESRLLNNKHSGADLRQARFQALKNSPIAIETDAANEQHYEVPAPFYHYVLGDRLKYSACLWDDTTDSLDEAELAMLEVYGERAELEDGQHVLDLGCGWGSASLWLATRYPGSMITAVSNSESQRRYIEATSRAKGINNLEVITCDVNQLDFNHETFDRIVSVEMLEHVRNYDILFSKIKNWLKPQGKFFVHIFSHHTLVYPFETEGEKNWMGRHFFTGGLMPSIDTFEKVQNHLEVEKKWQVNGRHYAKTAEAWLSNMDFYREEILGIFRSTYGPHNAEVWFQRWRMFFMACAELFGYGNGKEWLVCHYRFTR